jgi:hypothetical protein
MAMPVPNTTLVKKKKPLDDLDELANARMGAAKSETAVEAVAKPVAESARQANTYAPRQQDPAVGMSEQQLARKAALDELEAGKAKALQDASARAGAGGFGLSGATAALASDIGKVQDRNKVLTMAEFDKRARDEAFADLQRDVATQDYEDAYDIDRNNDGLINGVKVGGLIGDGDPNNDPDTTKSEDKPDAVVPEAGGKKKSIADMSDKEFNNLSKEQAEAAGWEAEQWLAEDKKTPVGAIFAKYCRWVGPNGEERIVPVDDVGELMSGGLEWED